MNNNDHENVLCNTRITLEFSYFFASTHITRKKNIFVSRAKLSFALVLILPLALALSVL